MKTAIIVFLCIIILGLGGVFFFPKAEPIAIEESKPIVVLPEEKKTYTLLFAGDIMLARSVQKQIEREQDPLYPFARIADTVREADMAFANLEGPVSARGINQGSMYSFRFEPVGTMNSLRFAGFDVVSIANNHIWDWGKDALTDTVLHLDEAGIGHVGAGRNAAEANQPFIAQLDDTKIAMLGYTNLYPKSLEAGADYPGISSFDVSSTVDQVQRLKRIDGVDLAIVSLHWGTEYVTSSDAMQQGIARRLIDGGADLVIGHHPHVAQEVEKYGEGYIVYSLGNFVFDQNLSRITMKGLMVRAYIKDKKVERIEEIPIQLTPTFQPYIPGAPGDPELDVVE
jgi:poly-gamma-glutamate synthesis protein (capsule biosynthesis protein)